MEDLLDVIRAGIAPNALPDARATAAAACRSILAALGDAPPAPPAIPDVAGMVAALRGVPPDQLLELAIARLRAALPAGADLPAGHSLKFHLVPLPPRGTP